MFAIANTPGPGVAVVGSINTDLVVFVPRLPTPGETVSGRDLLTGGGGKGANQAVAAARLGAHVRLLGRVGDDDFGRAAISNLVAAGIAADALLTTPGVPSGVALIFVAQGGQNMIALSPGANARLSAADVDGAWSRLRTAGVLLLQLEVPIEANLRAVELAKRDGVRVVLNPAPAPGEPLPTALLEGADVVVPNEAEARSLTGVDVSDLDGAERAARRLREMGPRAAIVTLGERGALVHDGEVATHVPALDVEAVDATAAGDAFCGALGVALARGDSLLEAARFATTAAAFAVTLPGAQASMPTLADVERLRERRGLT